MVVVVTRQRRYVCFRDVVLFWLVLRIAYHLSSVPTRRPRRRVTLDRSDGFERRRPRRSSVGLQQAGSWFVTLRLLSSNVVPCIMLFTNEARACVLYCSSVRSQVSSPGQDSRGAAPKQPRKSLPWSHVFQPPPLRMSDIDAEFSIVMAVVNAYLAPTNGDWWCSAFHKLPTHVRGKNGLCLEAYRLIVAQLLTPCGHGHNFHSINTLASCTHTPSGPRSPCSCLR